MTQYDLADVTLNESGVWLGCTDANELAKSADALTADQGRYDHEDQGARQTHILWSGPDRIDSHP